jgi:RNA polymerase-binding transcription factor DksA
MSVPRRLTLRDRRSLRTAIVDEMSRLDEQVASLTRSFDDIVAAAALTSTDDEHDPEGATIAFERAQVSALLHQAQADRAALRRRMDLLDDDVYGICEECGGFIGVERLMALPAASRCVICAR